MARIADPQKIENIKRATMEMMVDTGYKGLTVSKIAKNAGVSVGYLYRHYEGKIELIEALIDEYFAYFKEQLFGSIKNAESIRSVIELFIEKVVTIALEDPVPVQFLTTLAHDQQFHSEKTGISLESEITHFLNLVMNKGWETAEISKHVTILEIYLMLIQYPLDYVTLKLSSGFAKRELDEKDIKKISDVVCNAIK